MERLSAELGVALHSMGDALAARWDRGLRRLVLRLSLQALAGESGGLNAEDRKRAAAWLERRTTQMGKHWCAHTSAHPQEQKKGEV